MFQFPPLTPFVRALLLVLGLSFIAQTIAFGVGGVPVVDLLGLYPQLDVSLAWQWLTYPLVEPISDRMVLNRALDLLFIYFMLSPHEARFGARRVAGLALAGVVGAAVVVIALGLLVPSLVAGTAGASPIFWAAFGAFAHLAGPSPVQFVMLPPARAYVMLAAFLAIPLLSAFWYHDATMFFAAAAAAGAGILWARAILAPKKPTKLPPRRQAPPGRFRVIEGGGEGSDDDDDKPRWLN